MAIENTEEGLKRVVGIPGLAATVVNFSIGAGIYALPALIGIQLGPYGVIGYLLCGLMFTAIILCYVEVGSRIKNTGGSYAYVEAAFGPFAGFIVNWLFFFGWGILSDAAIMNLVADSLALLFPIFAGWWMRFLLIASLVGLMVLINVRDVRRSMRIVSLVTLIKLIPLLWIIFFGVRYIQPDNLRMEHWPPLSAFNNTALILFFAFAGFESSLTVSGEIKNPKRTVPLGILIGGLTVFIIYILIQTITQGVLGTTLSEVKDAPLAAIAEKIAGPVGITILLMAAAVSGLGAVNGDVLASSRLLYAGARDRLFPTYLSRIHSRFATPHMAVMTYAGLILIFSISGGFKQLAILASGALLLIYLGVILALIKLRMTKDDQPEKSFRVPGGLWIPGMAIAAIIYVLSNLSMQEKISIGVFVGAVCVIYVVMKQVQGAGQRA